MKFRLDPR